jgi:hypothetical protein
MTTPNEFSRCVAQYDPHALPVSAAQAIARQWAAPVTAVERVALRDALDRVLAADIVSPIDVPSHDNSAMDGYAFKRAALATEASTIDLTIVGKALAGHPFAGRVEANHCVRVMTATRSCRRSWSSAARMRRRSVSRPTPSRPAPIAASPAKISPAVMPRYGPAASCRHRTSGCWRRSGSAK